MPKKDLNQLAKFIVDQATDETVPNQEKKAIAAARSKGGKAGGAKRAATLTEEQRKEIARLGATARWKKS